MWRIISLIILYGLISLPVNGQRLRFQYVPDSVIANLPDSDSTKILMLLDSGKYFLDKQGAFTADLDSASAYFKKAINLSDALQTSVLKYEGISLLGISYLQGDQIAEGKKCFMQVIEHFHRFGDKEKEAEAWFKLGYYMPWITAHYPEILDNFNQSQSLYHQLGNQEKEIRVYKEIADIHLNQGKLEQAEEEFLQVIAMYQSIGYQKLHYTYDLLSVVARLKGEFNQGLQYALQGVESMDRSQDSIDAPFFYSRVAHIYRDLGQTDQSIEWYQRELNAWIIRNHPHIYLYRDAAYLVQELIKQQRTEEAYAVIRKIKEQYPAAGKLEKSSLAQACGHYYQAIGQNDKAEKYFLSMVTELKGLEPYETTSEAQHHMGKFYVQLAQYEKARKYLNDALALPPGIINASRILEIHYLLFKVDSASGNYLSAIEHFRLHKSLSDSLFNTAKSRQIEELQISYETAQKERNIELLENKTELQQNQLQQAKMVKNITIGGIILLLIFVGLLYNQFRIKQSNNLEMRKKNNTLQQLLDEKEWLLKEVHHRVKNNLQVVMSLMNSQSAYLDNDDAVQAFRESRHRMQAMSLIHQKLYQSDHIDFIDINAYIRELVNFLQDSFGTEHHFNFALNVPKLQMDVSQATPLGLILNEAISNAIKYAFPENTRGEVSISLSALNDGYYQLIIADNGVGLAEGFAINSSNTLGMNLMQGLSKQLEGSFHFYNENGLRLIIKFPLKKFVEPEFEAFFKDKFASND